ncbi:fibroblast growth factor receptor 2-like isoform X2 [Oscarella lobularis]|uniref:fibroblast growth factor receptor 2-like isoform X2 n=1 Tax=Oscarella lobularis TaxID=121494 RepID=UPI0033135652
MNSNSNETETGLSTRDRILLASLTPSIVVLVGIIIFLLLWRRKRTSEHSDQERIIDETDGRSSPANDTLKSNKSSKHGENFAHEANENPTYLAPPNARSKSANVTWMPTTDLYQSKRGRGGWRFPPLLGIEQEFPRDQLCTIKNLGESPLAKLIQGEATMLIEDEPTSTTVIVKTVKDSATNAQLGQFNEEIRTLAALQHSNVLELSAVCTTSHPMSMIFRIEDFIGLQSYLHTAAACHEPFGDTSFFSRNSIGSAFSDLLISNDLLAICHQVVQGMAYLAKEGYVHKDLAARNCYISDGVHVKISNFGIALDASSDDYVQLPLAAGTMPRNVKLSHVPLPIRWMAPESLQSGLFTTESDVWSFGILMWEVFALGKRPYEFSTDKEVLEQVAKHGHTIDCPPGCPPEIHALMTKCWRQTPESRATFDELRVAMDKWIKEGRFSDHDRSTSSTTAL